MAVKSYVITLCKDILTFFLPTELETMKKHAQFATVNIHFYARNLNCIIRFNKIGQNCAYDSTI